MNRNRFKNKNKFSPPADPMEQEARRGHMEPRQDWMSDKLNEYLMEYSANQQLGGRTPIRPLPSGPDPNPYFKGGVNQMVNLYLQDPQGKRGLIRSSPEAPQTAVREDTNYPVSKDEQRVFQEMVNRQKYRTWEENLVERARKEYVIEFINWLMGKSELNLDLKKTPWGRNKLVGPGISQFVEDFIGKKTEYELGIQKLRATIPSNLEEAWKYYKFIATKKDLVGPNSELASGGKIDPDAYDWDFLPELDYWLKQQQGWSSASQGQVPKIDQLGQRFDSASNNTTRPTESMNQVGAMKVEGVDSDLGGYLYPQDQSYMNKGDPGTIPTRVINRPSNEYGPPGSPSYAFVPKTEILNQ